MSDEIEFRRVTSDEEAAFLLPGSDDGLHVVLFCDAGAPAVEKARELAPEVEIPGDWDLVWLDPEGAEETAARFGLTAETGMAVIEDGTLLDVEYECSIETFRRLVDIAGKQSQSLTELG